MKESNIARASTQMCEKGGPRKRNRARKNERGRVCVIERGVHRISEREVATDRKEKKSGKDCARRDLKEGERGGSERDEYDVQR